MIKQIYEIINIFSASLPYYTQILKFKETKNSEGYSLKVSLLIIVSCVLRIFFWFGQPFHWSLLAQAFLLITTHIFLIYEAVKCKNYKIVTKHIENNKNLYNEEDIKITKINNRINSEEKSELLELKNPLENLKLINKLNKDENLFEILNFKHKRFFNWNTFNNYIMFILVLIIFIISLFQVFGKNNQYFVNTIGIFSTLVEGCMSVPQIFEIIKTKNVKNLSITLIGCWFFGDIIKTIYFFTTSTPFQFKILGVIQVSLNFVIVYLYLNYKK